MRAESLICLKEFTLKLCNVCSFYENDVCTNPDSPKYNSTVNYNDTCVEGDFDETIADREEYDGDDEENDFDED